jgi:hypothetical protein
MVAGQELPSSAEVKKLAEGFAATGEASCYPKIPLAGEFSLYKLRATNEPLLEDIAALKQDGFVEILITGGRPGLSKVPFGEVLRAMEADARIIVSLTPEGRKWYRGEVLAFCFAMTRLTTVGPAASIAPGKFSVPLDMVVTYPVALAGKEITKRLKPPNGTTISATAVFVLIQASGRWVKEPPQPR